MNRSLFRWVSLIIVLVLFVLLVPVVSALAAAARQSDLLSARVYLPLVIKNSNPPATPTPTPTVAPTPIPGEMVSVPAGSFPMGCDPLHNGGYDCNSDELPLRTVYLDAYQIDKTEVTNAAYLQCVADGICAAPSDFSSFTRSSYYDNPVYANYPVIYVEWNQAKAYCAWAKKRLPSEAEWEKAARGPTIQAYPWGDASPTCALANFGGANGGASTCVGDTSQVGSYPAMSSPYGALDMAGNVWEWVNDWYDANYYSGSPLSNPTGPITGTDKVLRGGSWNSDGYNLRVSIRFWFYPGYGNFLDGFRCAR
jgi:eukaryotic-like serine/threonine-protein kinase